MLASFLPRRIAPPARSAHEEPSHDIQQVIFGLAIAEAKGGRLERLAFDMRYSVLRAPHDHLFRQRLGVRPLRGHTRSSNPIAITKQIPTSRPTPRIAMISLPQREQSRGQKQPNFS